MAGKLELFLSVQSCAALGVPRVVQLSAPSIAHSLTSQTPAPPPPPPFVDSAALGPVSGVCTVCLFVSGLFNLAQFPKVGPHHKPGSEFPGFLVQTNIALYVCTFFSLTIRVSRVI